MLSIRIKNVTLIAYENKLIIVYEKITVSLITGNDDYDVMMMIIMMNIIMMMIIMMLTIIMMMMIVIMMMNDDDDYYDDDYDDDIIDLINKMNNLCAVNTILYCFV